jgi:hypothetical protein
VKQLTGGAEQVIRAPLANCYVLLADPDGYPRWHPDLVRSVEVLERGDDGQPTRARAQLRVSRGPLSHDFDVVLAVLLAPLRTVTLTRLPHERRDREQFQMSWHLEPEASVTRIRLALDATLSIPRLVPVGGIGNELAREFVAAAERALTRRG